MADWFVSLSIPAAMYWLCALILLALLCAAGFDFLLDKAFPEDQQ